MSRSSLLSLDMTNFCDADHFHRRRLPSRQRICRRSFFLVLSTTRPWSPQWMGISDMRRPSPDRRRQHSVIAHNASSRFQADVCKPRFREVPCRLRPKVWGCRSSCVAFRGFNAISLRPQTLTIGRADIKKQLAFPARPSRRARTLSVPRRESFSSI